MRKSFPPFRFALYVLCALCLIGTRAYGQERDKHESNEHPNGIVQDWSRRHLAYPRFGPMNSLISLQNDPRALLSWQESFRRDWHRGRPRHHSIQNDLVRDWSISLGGGTTAPAMFPAKFVFDPTAAPLCASDFIVFPVNAVGGAAQPNIVGFNNLYSGTAGTAGICNAPAGGRTAGANDDGVSATTIFSYNVKAAGGIVATSPALSLDGTRIAFVETAAATTAHFHVLAWKNGDGVAANLQTVTSPKQITSGFVATAPAAGSGTASDLALGSSSDTLSSPFVDYVHDTAYVGNDTGTLFRIKNVFCTTVACTGGGSPAPSLDGTWGSGGALSTPCAGKLTGVVVSNVGSVFAGCSDGKLYGYTLAGVALTNSPLTVGDGSAFGGIVDPPLVDEVNGFVYAVSGSGAGTNQVVVQALATTLGSPVTATLAPAQPFNIHSPAFNEAYFSGGTALLLEETPSSGTALSLYGITFGGGHVMNSGPPANDSVFTVGAFELSPATEFFSGTEDRLFESALNTASNNTVSFNITGAFPTGVESFTSEGTGTSGIIVDNNDVVDGQAASVYFGAATANTAVKLTQGGLQ